MKTYSQIFGITFLFIVGNPGLQAWQPSGWVYSNGDYQYAHGEGTWYWKGQGWDHWVVSLQTGHWQHSAVDGWCYYNWPYFYSFSQQQWFFTANPSETAWVVRLANDQWSLFGRAIVDTPAPGMVLVQGGTLVMSMGTRTVDTFYIGRYEVTWEEWKAVRTWAAANGYDIGSRGAGCADDHPVHSVAWYDVVKWCNLKSELEELPACSALVVQPKIDSFPNPSISKIPASPHPNPSLFRSKSQCLNGWDFENAGIQETGGLKIKSIQSGQRKTRKALALRVL